VTPLLFSDKIAAKEMLSKLQSIPTINRAVLYNENARTFADYKKPTSSALPSFKEHLSRWFSLFFEDEIIVSSPVNYDNQTYGAVVLYISTKDI